MVDAHLGRRQQRWHARRAIAVWRRLVACRVAIGQHGHGGALCVCPSGHRGRQPVCGVGTRPTDSPGSSTGGAPSTSPPPSPPVPVLGWSPPGEVGAEGKTCLWMHALTKVVGVGHSLNRGVHQELGFHKHNHFVCQVSRGYHWTAVCLNPKVHM